MSRPENKGRARRLTQALQFTKSLAKRSVDSKRACRKDPVARRFHAPLREALLLPQADLFRRPGAMYRRRTSEAPFTHASAIGDGLACACLFRDGL
ncbi:MAG: hypothetical protein JKY65_33055 [Planctomycetes bacterium]|nr:hypothetical protein [Planctomycetota bacterium]